MTPFLTRLIAPILAAALWCCVGQVSAQVAQMPRDHHVWGRFAPGAWTLVRQSIESLDAQGAVVSTSETETKSTLIAADAETYTLKVESTVLVAGKRIVAPARIIRRYYDEISADLTVTHRSIGFEEVVVDDTRYRCQVYETEYANQVGRTKTRTWYSATVAPYVLRRELTTTDPSQAQVTGRTSLEVLAVEMPEKVLNETEPASHVRLTRRRSGGVTKTLLVQTPEAPGGVVSHSSKELDRNGHVIRRSTLELVRFDAQPAHAAKSSFRQGSSWWPVAEPVYMTPEVCRPTRYRLRCRRINAGLCRRRRPPLSHDSQSLPSAKQDTSDSATFGRDTSTQRQQVCRNALVVRPHN